MRGIFIVVLLVALTTLAFANSADLEKHHHALHRHHGHHFGRRHHGVHRHNGLHNRHQSWKKRHPHSAKKMKNLWRQHQQRHAARLAEWRKKHAALRKAHQHTRAAKLAAWKKKHSAIRHTAAYQQKKEAFHKRLEALRKKQKEKMAALKKQHFDKAHIHTNSPHSVKSAAAKIAHKVNQAKHVPKSHQPVVAQVAEQAAEQAAERIVESMKGAKHDAKAHAFHAEEKKFAKPTVPTKSQTPAQRLATRTAIKEVSKKGKKK
jgi:hypothetical protein